MNAKALKSINVKPSEYKAHFIKAKDFFEGMKLSEEKALWHSVGLNAVHCAISLSDALTIYHLSKRFSGEDHRQAFELLSRVPGHEIQQQAVLFHKILSKKHMIAYEEREFRQSEAIEIVKQVKRFYQWAQAFLPQ